MSTSTGTFKNTCLSWTDFSFSTHLKPKVTLRSSVAWLYISPKTPVDLSSYDSVSLLKYPGASERKEFGLPVCGASTIHPNPPLIGMCVASVFEIHDVCRNHVVEGAIQVCGKSYPDAILLRYSRTDQALPSSSKFEIICSPSNRASEDSAFGTRLAGIPPQVPNQNKSRHRERTAERWRYGCILLPQLPHNPDENEDQPLGEQRSRSFQNHSRTRVPFPALQNFRLFYILARIMFSIT